MNLITKTMFALSCVIIFSGCASIVSKSNWPYTIDSEPRGASITITNRKGIEIYSGKTPATMKLKSGSAFFSKESYSVVFKKDGYEPKKVNVECKLNGWYFGNILIGGLIGMLIVDPATGAMYKLEGEGITETLSAQKSTTSVPQLKIMNIGDLPADTKARLVKL